MRVLLLSLFLINAAFCLEANNNNDDKNTEIYYSWILGNPGDYQLPDESVLDGGVLLAGGSTDQDNAMIWFLNKARGGDVIVFRNGRNASVSEYPTADAYNIYLYSELGVKVDSVETIFLNSRNVANNLEVVDKVKKAEAVFFTGMILIFMAYY